MMASPDGTLRSPLTFLRTCLAQSVSVGRRRPIRCVCVGNQAEQYAHQHADQQPDQSDRTASMNAHHPNSSPDASLSASAVATDQAIAVGRSLVHGLNQVMADQARAVRLTITGLLAGGHVLLEGAPGVGKTTLAKTLVAATGTDFARVQGTSDLLPTDITGVSIYDQRTGEWVFRPGPLVHHVVLFDEINRATPRAQSALLEAMAEGQVTVDGERRALPDPFFLIATQNPAGEVGTYPLVAGQRDRFALVVTMARPSRDAERALLTQTDLGQPQRVGRLVTPDELRAAIDATSNVYVAGPIADYLLDVVDAVRRGIEGRTLAHQHEVATISPRASKTLLRLTQAWAVTDGRAYVIPDDVRAVAGPTLAHRLLRSGDDRLTALVDWVDAVTLTVPLP
jgi:MoxR-like ATPase